MFYFRRRLRLYLTGLVLLFSFIGIAFVALNSSTTSPPADADNAFPASAIDANANADNNNNNGKMSSSALFEHVRQEVKNSPIDAEKIVESIEFLNKNHRVLNGEKFGDVKNSTVSFVIAIQVHKRLEYLLYLVNSLRAVKGIENALLVFSHDLNDDSINRLVRSINFCRVIQIFYPYNIQIFPNMFPGHDPRDCPVKATKAEAENSKCRNRKYPDKYGHYRHAAITQIKHHWWWKMSYIFDGVLKRYQLDAWVIFLEEDHFVAPDFLYVLNQMVLERPRICADCNVLSLGAYLKTYENYKADLATLGAQPWYSSKHNMGMALSWPLWEELRNCSDFFCTYDDYNWDWSLLKVGLSCLQKKLVVLYAKSPRVLHIGDCGVHAHNCVPHNAASSAQQLFDKYEEHFFPPKMVMSGVTKRMYKPSKPNGGWGDIRDHALCRLNTYAYAATAADEVGGAAPPTRSATNSTLRFNSILSLV